MPKKDPVWKEVPNFPYEVSNDGQVRNATTGKLLKLQIYKGYYRLMLYNKGEKKRFLIHRLVAFLFLGPPPINKTVVNHIDGNKLNNSVENLEWVTHQENTLHARDVLGTMKLGENQSQSKLTDIDVINIRMLVSEKQKTKKEIAAIYNVDPSLIASIASGKDWKHIGGVITPTKKQLQTFEINDIKEMISNGIKQKDICKQYGVVRETIRRIARGINKRA